MNRRDLLKMLGIGGVGAVANVVSGKEAEAAEIPIPKPVMMQGTPQLPGWEYIGSSKAAASGTASVYVITDNDGRVIYNLGMYEHRPSMDMIRAQDYDFGGDE